MCLTPVDNRVGMVSWSLFMDTLAYQRPLLMERMVESENCSSPHWLVNSWLAETIGSGSLNSVQGRCLIHVSCLSQRKLKVPILGRLS